MRFLNTCGLPHNIDPVTLLNLHHKVSSLNFYDRNTFSFITNQTFVSDMITSKSFGPNVNVLSVAIENILDNACIVQVFSGFPAEQNQLEFFLGDNNELQTIMYQDFLHTCGLMSDAGIIWIKPYLYDLENLLYIID